MVIGRCAPGRRFSRRNRRRRPCSASDYRSSLQSTGCPQARVELLTDQAKWAEGPLCLADGRLIWSDIKANKVSSWQAKGGVSTWLEKADFQNGHTLDGQGRVVAASHGKRGIVRQEPNGEWHTLVDTYQGKRLNSPNDVVADKSGALWFPIPPSGC